MKWFKHHSDMSEDVKIKRLIRRYQSEGYAVYNLIIERIVKKLSAESPYPVLEENAEDIADMLRMDQSRVEDIVRACIEIGLLEDDEIAGRVVAHKIYKYIDQSMVNNHDIRKMIAEYKRVAGVPEGKISKPHAFLSSDVKLESSSASLEEKRREENREEGERALGSFVKIPENQYNSLVEDFGEETITDYAERVDLYCQSKGKRYKDYAATIRNWLRRDGVEKRRQTTFNDDFIPEIDDPDYERKSKERLLREIGA